MRKLVCLCLAMVVVLTACSSGSTSSGIGDTTGRWTINFGSRTSTFRATGSMTLTQIQPLLSSSTPSESGLLSRLATFIGIESAIAQLAPRDVADLTGLMAIATNECFLGGPITGQLVGEQIQMTLNDASGAVVEIQGTTNRVVIEGLYVVVSGRTDIVVETSASASLADIDIGVTAASVEQSDCSGQSGNWSAKLVQ
ncbi:MAG: hypothetical protein OEQ39_29245 [Gammaproteobacteria bacterium]|nr:hypothetical protein [Gammaproteobacteria bacterium]MDH3465409.1 hypothetical protein [Gammaproteobacteria bacterium]